MKSLITLLLLFLSVFFAGRHTDTPANTTLKETPPGKDFFHCTIDGIDWSPAGTADHVSQNNGGLSVAFLHRDNTHIQPCGMLISATRKANKQGSYFYIQPLDQDTHAILQAHTNIYHSIYITYKTADGRYYSTHTSPGNFEITQMDTVHKYMTGRFNCILYSSVQQDYILVTNGKFCFRLTDKPLVRSAVHN